MEPHVCITASKIPPPLPTEDNWKPSAEFGIRFEIGCSVSLDDLGFSPEKAAVLKMKAEFHAALLRSARNYTQKELQTILKEPQPRVSEFMNGKIASVSMEKMTLYAYRLGAKPRIHLEYARTHPRVATKGLVKRGGRAGSRSKQAATAFL